ncbi:MAG: hypothetical protein B6D57_01020 [Candidatus Coatesbacteria bacterium 4484_99]|uniref:FAD:protein FMN transferase n=1 Tax=Candidatus Coatesbacteria bacterium 4484_99 TaxID=1970774 RepID=A0A1W9S2Q1_9BACT|nr:MAG: hypothetical protein B6D57_01020 [Candidatus Coatesbacteria bacterium 4484_99]
MHLKIISLSLSIIFVAQFIFCNDEKNCKQEKVELFFTTMGTSAHVLIYPRDGCDGEEILRKMHERVEYVEHIANRFDETSEVSLINSMDVGDTMRVSREMIDLLIFSREMTERTDGAFDPTYISGVSSAVEIDDGALMPSGWEALDIDTVKCTIAKLGYVLLDLGAVAKGWACDYALDAVRGSITGGMVEIGGDIAIYGRPPDGDGWIVSIPDCFGSYCLKVSGEYGVALSSSRRGGSGEYHIVDARGKVKCIEDAYALAVAVDSATADAFATAMIVLGEESIKTLNQTENLEGMLCIEGKILKSENIDRFLHKGLWGNIAYHFGSSSIW